MAQDFQYLIPAALKVIAEQHKVKDLQPAGVVADRLPSTGAHIYHVSAVAKDQPNGPIYSVVVDEKGAAVDVGTLAKTEKVEFFPPFPRMGTEGANPAVKVERPPAAAIAAGVSAVPPAPGPAAAVTINPTVNDLRLEPGETFSEDVHVMIPAMPAPLFDVYFLADTTGSMGGLIASVKAGVSNIMTTLNGMFPTMAFAVGNYKDFDGFDPYCFQHQQSATTNTVLVQAAINTWAASGGGDTPEGQFFALDQIALTPAFWRTGAQRILVWFGDAPGHDPICAGLPGVPVAITEAIVKTNLFAAGIRVLAISCTTIDPAGLNGVPSQGSFYTCANIGTAGQATRIVAAAAPGSALSSGVNPATISNTIINMVTAAANIYNNVNLVPTGATAPYVTSITPAGGYGPVSGTTAHDYVFHVVFTGPPCKSTDQVFTGTLDVVADGKVLAHKNVTLTVVACERWAYAVKFVCGIVKATDPATRESPPLRPGFYATEVNILNYHRVPVTVRKYLYPLMHTGEPIGREPRYVGRRAEDAITLPPQTATYDDCSHLHELLHEPPVDGPLSIYWLEIVSPVELAVTAVYTANDTRGLAIALDVEQIVGKALDPPTPTKPGIPIKSAGG